MKRKEACALAVYRGFVRTIPDGNPVPNGTPVEFRAEADDSLLHSTTTTGGEFVYTPNGTLPPHYIQAIYSGQTHIVSSKTTGMTGAVTIPNLAYLLQAWGDGVIENVLNELAVTANGANMQLTIATGAAQVHGVVYDRVNSGTLNVGAADPTNPRIDTVVVSVVPVGAGSNIEGESYVEIVQGSPAASPVAPSLTQGASLWQFPLADIAVGAGVTAISPGDVTDRRIYVTAGHTDQEIFDLIDQRLQDLTALDAGVKWDEIEILGVPFKVLRIIDEYVQDLLSTTLVAGSNITLNYDDGANTLEISSSGGGGGGSPARKHDDTNFTTTGELVSGTRTLGSASITLDPGTYLLHSQVNLSAFNNDNVEGYVTVSLDGNGAPTGGAASSRNFRTRSNDSRQIVLTGRRLVSPVTQTVYTVNAKATHLSGGNAYLEDGVVFLWAE